MNTEAVLPDKLSELIHVALRDLEAAEKAPNIVIDMGEWHTPLADGKCAVCLAGAVMRGTFGVNDGISYAPAWFDASLRRKLEAIDLLRTGYVAVAIARRTPKLEPTDAFDRDITPYSEDPAAFKADMLQLAKDLEEAGL